MGRLFLQFLIGELIRHVMKIHNLKKSKIYETSLSPHVHSVSLSFTSTHLNLQLVVGPN
jgi:hypothetical protein